MTDLLNLFKEKADEFLATINQKGGVRATIEGLRRQMAEADRRRAMGRVKAELRRLDRQISEMITAVGVQAVALQEAGQLTSPELQPLCQHIIDLKATLSEQQAELAALEAAPSSPAATAPEAATTPCANCGRPVPIGAAFCPYCGAAVAPTASAPPSAPTPPRAATPRATPPPAVAEPSAAPRPTAAPTPDATPAARAGAAPETSAAKATCAYCGAPLKPGARFCSRCGRAV